MAWGAVAIAGATIISGYMASQSASGAAAAGRRDAKSAAEAEMAMRQKELDFAREQYDDWQDVYGPIQENLASFYGSLNADQLAATGLQKQAETFAQVRQGIKRTAAQKGYSSPALDMMEQQIDIEEAKGKAAIRANAPQQVAQAQSAFVAAGRGGNPMAAGVQSAYGGMAGAYGQQGALARERQAAGESAYGKSMEIIGQGIGQGASAYGRYQDQQAQTRTPYRPEGYTGYERPINTPGGGY